MRRALGGWVAGWMAGAVGLLGGSAVGQQQIQPPGLPQPRIYVVAPAGGRAGEAVEIAVTGHDLDDPQGLLFSRPGLEATPLGVAQPPASPQARGNRGQGMRQALGPIATQRFRVTIPADAPPGPLDVRVLNRWGASNPRVFVVGDLRECVEAEPNNDVAEAQRIEINTCINGSIGTATDVDEFVFDARKGQRVLVSGLASSLDSRLLLALEVYDGSGKRIASGHEYQGTDALLDLAIPADGAYLIRAFAFTYSQGDPQHFYRLSVSTAPWIDAVFPPVVQAGTSARVTVFGRNLPGGKLDPAAVVDGRPLETLGATIQAPDDPSGLSYNGALPSTAAFSDGFEYRVKNAVGASNPFLIVPSEVPVVHDRGGNDTWETAQEVEPPCAIAGRVERPGDLDWYAFPARKGEVWVIEGLGERIGSPLDLYFAIRSAQSKQMLVEVDDEPQVQQRQNPPALFTRTDDPGRHRFVAPADGRYELLVSTREAPSQFGPRHLYVVRIAREQPDFRLVVMPASNQFPDALVVGRGGQAEANVFVDRRDGFIGEIELSADGLPEGVTCPPQVVGTGMKEGLLVLSATADARDWAGRIAIKGTATSGGRKLVREARGATISWPVPQPNIIPISRVDRGLVLAVRDRPPLRLAAEATELTLHHGDKQVIPLKRSWLWPEIKGVTPTFETANLPQALNGAVAIAANPEGGQATLTIGPAAPPGVYSLVFRARAQVPFHKDPEAKNKPNVQVSAPSNPVVVRIVPKELGKVSVGRGDLTLRPGQSGEVTVNVSRLFNYRGEFRARVVVPADAPEITAEPGVVVEDANQVRLTVKAGDQAKPGARVELTARLDANLGDSIETTQEAKFIVQIAK